MEKDEKDRVRTQTHAALKNIVHNELGITPEVLKEWVQEAVEKKVEKAVAAIDIQAICDKITVTALQGGRLGYSVSEMKEMVAARISVRLWDVLKALTK